MEFQEGPPIKEVDTKETVRISPQIITDLAVETKTRSMEDSGEFFVFIMDKGGEQVKVRVGIGHGSGVSYTAEQAVDNLRPFVEEGFRVVADYHNHPRESVRVYEEVGMPSEYALSPSTGDLLTDVPLKIREELGQEEFPHLIGIYANDKVYINGFKYVREPSAEEGKEIEFEDPSFQVEEPDELGIRILADNYTRPKVLLDKGIIKPVEIDSEVDDQGVRLNIPIEKVDKRNLIEQQRQIREYTTEELHGEKRIETPMSTDCKVAVCIPSYNEGSDILNTLHSLSQQESVDKDEYEVLVCVNNTGDASEEVLESNNQTIKLMRAIQGETSLESLELDENSLKKVKEIQESGIAIYFVDKSSKGNEIIPVEGVRVGPILPRKRVMDEASLRFVEAGNLQGVIASLDADSLVSRNWVGEIIKQFENPSLQMLAGERRDGLKVDEDSKAVDAFDDILEWWNTQERINDPILGILPPITSENDRVNILEMRETIREYNRARREYTNKRKGKGEKVSHFKGGSGKAWRIDTYADKERSLQLLNLVDAGGNVPANIPEDSIRYIGREDRTKDLSDDASVESLAVYPDCRIRSWDLDSEEYNRLENPTGSSGKEYAYAVRAGLENRLPTCFNPELTYLSEQVDNLVKGISQVDRDYLESVVGESGLGHLDGMTEEELHKLQSNNPAVVEKYQSVVDAVGKLPRKVDIKTATKFYKSVP